MPQNVYIHIPFCKSKCKYCSFVSYTNCEKKTQIAYVDTLIKEIKYFYKNEPLKTLYFGGGTPSLLVSEDVKKIVDCFCTSKETEITLELNPETVDKEYLQRIWDTGINRLSIGIQSFNDPILKSIGRIHTADRATSTIKIAQNIGFTNISVDFIYGLPHQTQENFISDLKKATDLDIQHISLYGLKIEEGCIFFQNPPSEIANDDTQADMYLNAIKTLEKKGFARYEISNFSKTGFESKHNLNYWNCGEYYGFGTAAHGYENGIRYSNFVTIEDYLKNYRNKSSAQTLTKQERLEEAIYLGLRRSYGIDINKINALFNIDFDNKYNKLLAKYTSTGHLIKTSDGYKLSNEGVLVSNIILADFIDC